MKIKEVILTLEQFAPLPLQESYDNAGLQLGFTDVELSGVLLCLDITEQVIGEAIANHCNMIVSHHPLLFHGLKRIADDKYVERCVRRAILNNLTIYSAHTNLDNADNGMNFIFAEKLKLHVDEFLAEPKDVNGVKGGSGVIASFSEALLPSEFLHLVQTTFDVECLTCNKLLNRDIKRVAICTGAGDYLLEDACRKGVDAFITGEMHYHQYFGFEDKLQIVVIGHYQSEQIVKELFKRILKPFEREIKIYVSNINTNPINYKYGY